MVHAENSLVINKPIEDVYDFLADGLNNLKWRPAVINITLAAGSAGIVGAEYKQEMKGPGGRTIAGDYRITVADLNKELSFVVTAGPARPTGSYHLEAVPGGTKVTFTLDLAPKDLMWLMSPMIKKMMNSEVAQLSELKLMLES